MLLARYGCLGSVDANTGDELLGWDTDQFLTDVRRATQVMGVVLEQGGLAPGGLNFDAKVWQWSRLDSQCLSTWLWLLHPCA